MIVTLFIFTNLANLELYVNFYILSFLKDAIEG